MEVPIEMWLTSQGGIKILFQEDENVEQNNIKGSIKLICKSVWFYSSTDEDLFFEWIQRIPSIIKFDALYDEL